MFRALFEILITIAVVWVARAILTSLLKSIANVSANGTGSRARPNGARPDKRWTEPPPAADLGGELHKDPVCGTYVAANSALRRQSSGQTFYYCSEACREKHALVAR